MKGTSAVPCPGPSKATTLIVRQSSMSAPPYGRHRDRAPRVSIKQFVFRRKLSHGQLSLLAPASGTMEASTSMIRSKQAKSSMTP
jgi:hypothetical protein